MYLYHSSRSFIKTWEKPQHSSSLFSLVVKPAISVKRKNSERVYTSKPWESDVLTVTSFSLLSYFEYLAKPTALFPTPALGMSCWVFSTHGVHSPPQAHWKAPQTLELIWPFPAPQTLFPNFSKVQLLWTQNVAAATPASIFFPAIRGSSPVFSPAGDKCYCDKTLLFSTFDFTLTLKISINNYIFFFLNESDLMPHCS